MRSLYKSLRLRCIICNFQLLFLPIRVHRNEHNELYLSICAICVLINQTVFMRITFNCILLNLETASGYTP